MSNVNIWLQSYRNRINHTIYQMEEYRLKGSYGGNLNLQEIIQMLKGSCNEIQKLQNDYNELKKDYEGLIEQFTNINEGKDDNTI